MNDLPLNKKYPALIWIYLTAVFFLCAGILTYGAFHLPWLKTFLTKATYYIIFTLIVTWAITLIHASLASSFDILKFWKQHKKAIVLTFLASSIIFISVPHYFRVLSDETNLLSVARNITFNKEVDNVSEGKWYYERFWPAASSIEKRPFLFPFFTQIIHNLIGYNPENVFILNFFALWGLLFVLYLTLKPYVGEGWAFTGIILVLAQPMICLSATSGSYEIFNALFIGLSFLSLRRFLTDRTSASLQVLFVHLILLANIRYESIVFLAVIAILLVFKGFIKLENFKSSPALIIAPFFLLPWAAQRIIMAHEIDPNFNGGTWINVFSTGNFTKNTSLFFRFILDSTGQLGYAGLVNWMGLIILIILIAAFIFRQIKNSNAETNLLISAGLSSFMLIFIIALAYQGGINDHPMNGRLYLPILILISLAPAIIPSVLGKSSGRSHVYGLLLASAVFIYYHPVAMEDKLTNNLMIVREDRFVRDFLNKYADQKSLIICGRPGQLIVYNHGAVSYSTANAARDIILQEFRNHLYSQIYVIQSISYKTHEPFDDNVIDAQYTLEPVEQTQITGEYYIRISKVKLPAV